MAALFRRSPAICQCHRTFSTSAPRTVSLQWDKNDPEALAAVLPPYPYGPARWYKQSRLGLYGGQRIQFGNNVGEKSKTKTRRTWHPNIFTRKLFSKSLNRVVQVRVSSRVLRTIDKLGGLDEYLLGEKEARIKDLGESGWWLRWAIMQTSAIKIRFRKERQALGLSPELEQNEIIEEAFGNLAIAESSSEELLEQTEPLSMDDAFTVEQPENLPPIKFRVGPQKHVILTSKGWRRTRADPKYRQEHRQKLMKEEVAARLGQGIPGKLEHYSRMLERVQGAQRGVRLSETDSARLIQSTGDKFKREIALKADAVIEAQLKSAQRKKARNETRKLEGKRVHRKRETDGQSPSL